MPAKRTRLYDERWLPYILVMNYRVFKFSRSASEDPAGFLKKTWNSGVKNPQTPSGARDRGAIYTFRIDEYDVLTAIR